MEGGRSALKILAGKLTGKRRIGRFRHRWEDNDRMIIKEIGVSMRNWIDLTDDRNCECDIQPSGFINHGVSYLMYREIYQNFFDPLFL